VLHGKLGNYKKSEECFQLSLAVSMQLLRQGKGSIIVDMVRCQEEVALLLMVRGGSPLSNEVLSSKWPLLKGHTSRGGRGGSSELMKLILAFASSFGNTSFEGASSSPPLSSLSSLQGFSTPGGSPTSEAFSAMFDVMRSVSTSLSSFSSLSSWESITSRIKARY
jgi:hypothetical protein